MPVMTSVGASDHLPAEHLRHAGRLVPFHFRRIHVLQRLLGVLVRIRPYQRRDIRIRLIKTSHQRLDLFRLNERFIALNIYNYGVRVVLSPPGWGSDRFVCFQASIRTAFMVRSCHHHFTAKRLYRIVDTLIVGSYHYRVQGHTRLFIHTTDNGLTANLRQRFTRKTRRSIPRRYNSNKFHINLQCTIYNLQFIALDFREQCDRSVNRLHIRNRHHSSARRQAFLIFLFMQQASLRSFHRVLHNVPELLRLPVRIAVLHQIQGHPLAFQ